MPWPVSISAARCIRTPVRWSRNVVRPISRYARWSWRREEATRRAMSSSDSSEAYSCSTIAFASCRRAARLRMVDGRCMVTLGDIAPEAEMDQSELHCARHGPTPRAPQHPDRPHHGRHRAADVRAHVHRRPAVRGMSDQGEFTRVPPVGEEVHMPQPSVLPLINAAALASAIVSLTISWWLVGAGL